MLQEIPSTRIKSKESERIEKQIQEYLKSGKKIKEVPRHVMASDIKKGEWNYEKGYFVRTDKGVAARNSRIWNEPKKLKTKERKES